MLLGIETSRLLIQEEDVAVGRATGWWGRADIVRDERSTGVQSRGLGDFDAGLDPVQDGTQDTPGWEWSVDVQAHEEIDLGRVEACEGDLWRRLGVCGYGMISGSCCEKHRKSCFR